MSAEEGRVTAPRLVRWIGWYYIVLFALGAFVLFAARNNGGEWYQLPGSALSLAIGVGLLMEQRWAYVLAVVFGGVNFTITLLAVVLAVGNLSIIGALFALINALVMAPPLLLLSPPGRAWFQRREPAELSV